MAQEATSPATTAHWCAQGHHAWRCSHNEDEKCAYGDHSDVNCPEHNGVKKHRTRAVKLRVKPRPAENPTRKERQQWCEANIKQVTHALSEAGYQAGSLYERTDGQHILGSDGSASSIELWVGPGRQPVIGVQRYPDYMGFEVLVPLTSEQEMSLVVEALKQATARRSQQPEGQR